MSMQMQQPAQQSPLGQQGVSLLPGFWQPNRGLVLRSSEPALPKDSAEILNNLRWDGICWTTQKIGWTQQRAAVFNAGAQFLEMGVHCLANGSTQFIQQVGQQVQLYDPTQNIIPEQVLFTANSQNIPCMRSFSPNYFVYTNGSNIPQKWDGTTWSAMAPWPVTPPGGTTLNTPQFCESFNNRVVFAGFAADPFAILISDFGLPESFTLVGTPNATNGGLYHVPSQLGPITSLKMARMSQQSNQQILLIGCKFGFAFIAGLDSTSFTLVTASVGRWGIPSNRAWFQLDDNLYCLCSDGIRPFNANTTFSNLIASCLSFPVHPLITAFNRGQGAQAFVLDNPNELEATFYFCSGSDVQNRTALILNYADITNGLVRFSQKQFPPAINGQAPTSPACANVYQGRFWAGGYDGKLQELYVSSLFGTTPAQHQIRSPLFEAPTPAQEASARGFWILTQGPSMTWTAQSIVWTAQANGLGIRPVNTFSQELSVQNDGTTILGTWVLGVSYFGGPQYQITPFSPRGGGRAWQIDQSGNTGQSDFCFIGVFSTLTAGGTRQ